MGASTFWIPQGLSRAVMGLLYVLVYNISSLFSVCSIRRYIVDSESNGTPEKTGL
jgi:hypothetical protein